MQEGDKLWDAVQPELQEMRERLDKARALLPTVKMSPELRLKISEVCSLLNIDGVRGDIVTNRAVKAFVAFEGRDEVTVQDLERVMPMCINHRWGQKSAIGLPAWSSCMQEAGWYCIHDAQTPQSSGGAE